MTPLVAFKIFIIKVELIGLQHDTILASNLIQLVTAAGEGPHLLQEVRDEFVAIDTHSGAVTDASFAPDGTALATASKDGTVKFFQVTLYPCLSPQLHNAKNLNGSLFIRQIYFKERAPARCLYSWAPHDGKPIDKIFFLDNHTLSKDNPSE